MSTLSFLSRQQAAWLACLSPFIWFALLTSSVSAWQEQQPIVRELFVPYEELDVVLEADPNRVFLERKEYEALIEAARQQPVEAIPRDVVMSRSQLVLEIKAGRAQWRQSIDIEVLRDEIWFTIGLNLSNVGIGQANLDGAPAVLVRAADGTTQLLVRGKGAHTLELNGTALVRQGAAQQSIDISLPRAAANEFVVRVAGNVELRSGAPVRLRTYDEASQQTIFQIAPTQDRLALEFSTNNRQASDEQQLLAQSVLIDEVTQGYERLHATVSLKPLRGKLREVRFVLPERFDVTMCEAPQVARWEVVSDADRVSRLIVTLNQEVTDRLVLQLSLNRSAGEMASWIERLEDWSFPKLLPEATQGHVSLLGLWVEDRLVPTGLDQQGLLSVDSAAMRMAVPTQLTQAVPGAPRLRQTVAFVAPDDNYQWRSSLKLQEAAVKATMSTIVYVQDSGLSAQGSLLLRIEGESLFEFDWTIPSEWKLSSLKDANGNAVVFERVGAGDAAKTQFKVRLPQGIAAGTSVALDFVLEGEPKGWLDQWEQQEVALPDFRIDDGNVERGSMAIVAADDLLVLPAVSEGLIPLVESEKGSIGWNFPSDLAYRFSGPIRLVLNVQRKAPRLEAQVFSVFEIAVGRVRSLNEIQYSIREAGARSLSFSLPDSAPNEVTVLGLDGLVLREVSQEEREGRRFWTARLAAPVLEQARLSVVYDTPLEDLAEQNWSPAMLRAEGTRLHSSTIAIDGDPQLDVEIQTTARRVDEGEVAVADLPIGRRRIGTWGSVGAEPELSVLIRRREGFGLPTAVVQEGTIQTQLSVNGRIQSRADYRLSTKATLIEVQLPAEAQLWAVLLDGRPLKPQRKGDQLLCGLPVEESKPWRSLVVVYDSASDPLSWRTLLELPAPVLATVNAEGESEIIPVGRTHWIVSPPEGFGLQQRGGELQVVKRSRPLTGPEQLAGMIAALFEPVSMPKVSLMQLTDSMSFEAGESMAPSSAPAIREGYEHSGAYPQANSEPESPSAPAEFDALDPFGSGGERDQAANEEMTPGQSKDDASELERLEPLDQDRDNVTDAKDEGRSSLVDPLLGIGSLSIDLQTGTPGTELVGLGNHPQLRVLIYSRPLVDAFALLCGATSVLMGCWLLRRSSRSRLVWIMILMTVGGLTPYLSAAFDAWMPILNALFFAAWILVGFEAIVYYLARPIRRSCDWCCQRFTKRLALPSSVLNSETTTRLIGWFIGSSLVLALSGVNARSLVAQDVGNIVADPQTILKWLENLDGPVQVPADAIVVPFDPERPESMEEGSRVLVPYAKYVELWNRAYPDRPLNRQLAPYAAAISAARYEARLDDASELMVKGTLIIDLFDDEPATLPLPLSDATLTAAKLDGRGARLEVIAPNQFAAQRLPALPEGVPPTTMLLHVEGKGRHTLEIELRFPVGRRGGWNWVQGHLPGAVSASVRLIVPNAGTEIRQQQWIDSQAFETTRPDEIIETAMASSGIWMLNWRTQLASSEVDRALTVTSASLLDVREDGSRLTWKLNLAFPGTQRDAFTLLAPLGWNVERVVSENLRSFESREDGDLQRIDVTLLESVRDNATIVVQLSRRESLVNQVSQIQSPYLNVRDAALESGTLGVRVSPRLGLKVTLDDGVSRSDFTDELLALAGIAEELDSTVLTPVPFLAFRFVKPPFELHLEASPRELKTQAIWQGALRVDRREVAIEGKLRIEPMGSPVYRISVAWPEAYQLSRISPDGLEWSVEVVDGKRVLSIDLLDGRLEPFDITLFARTERVDDVMQEVGQRLELPSIEIEGVATWRGQWAMLADPDTDVQLQNLVNARELPTETISWLKSAQRELAKRRIEFNSSKPYGADIVLTPKTPRVRSRSLTNLRVTGRSVEATTLIDFTIEQAGVSELQIALPARWQDAQVAAKLLRSKRVTPALNADGEAREGWVLLTLELQDSVRGPYSVLLESDQPLDSLADPVILPEVVTGETNRRVLAIENAGRDEVVVAPESLQGMSEVGRQEQVWREVSTLLGDSIAKLYQSVDGASEAALRLSLVEREEVDRVGARIGLAIHTLVVDQAGGYRAKVEYRVDNASESLLEVVLPEGATLWTVGVAGEPVKPLRSTNSDERRVRIPLIRTELGEADYGVVILYGGRFEPMNLGRQISFPLIAETSINVELSQVKLYLPENHQWYFDGSLKQVSSNREFAIGFQSYLGRRIQEAQRALEGANSYSVIRAANNLKEARALFQANLEETSRYAGDEMHELRMAQAGNGALLREAEMQVQEQIELDMSKDQANRFKLNEIFRGNQTQRSSNVVSDLGSNFDAAPTSETATSATQFNQNWYLNNSLLVPSNQPAQASTPGADRQSGESRVTRGRAGGRGDQDAEQLRSQNSRTQMQFEQVAPDDLRQQSGQAAGLANRNQNALQLYQNNLSRGGAADLGAITNSVPTDGEGNVPGGPGGVGGPMGGGIGGGFGPGVPPSSSLSLAFSTNNFVPPSNSEFSSYEDSGLSSLELALPEQGELFMFTTPRGELELVARSFSNELLERGLGLVLVGLGLLVFYWVARRAVQSGSVKRRPWVRYIVMLLIGLATSVTLGISLVSALFVIIGLAGLSWNLVARRLQTSSLSAT